MLYCKECGNKLDDDAKFCQLCGRKIEISEIKSNENNTSPQAISNNTVVKSLKCPNCNSTDINTQIVTENKQTGCLTIFIYIVLALTIIGIPIMLIIILARGKKSVSKTVCVCQNCGSKFQKRYVDIYNSRNNILSNNKKQNISTEKIILIFFALFFLCMIVAVNINQYSDKPLSDVNSTYYVGDTVNFKYFSVKVDNCQIKYQNQPIDDYFVISDPEWIAVTFTYTNTSDEQRDFSKYKTRIINSKGEVIKPSIVYYHIWNEEYLESTQLLPNGTKTGFLQFSNTIKDKVEDLTLQISVSSNFEEYETYNYKLYQLN